MCGLYEERSPQAHEGETLQTVFNLHFHLYNKSLPIR